MGFASSRKFYRADSLNVFFFAGTRNSGDSSRNSSGSTQHDVCIDKEPVSTNRGRIQGFWKQPESAKNTSSCSGFRHSIVLAGAGCRFGGSIRRRHRII